MNRREIIALLGSAALWPVAARAQAMPVMGFMSARSFESDADLVAAFRKGLRAIGYIEGRNIRIEYRWADGQYDRLPAMAAELVAEKVTILVAAGGALAALAAKAATSTIPIVFMAGGDPIQLGLVVGFNRPGGNATGVNVFVSELGRSGLACCTNCSLTRGWLPFSSIRKMQLRLTN
jgi:putative tryptophan/tyrosine transport system substrate-binding protein